MSILKSLKKKKAGQTIEEQVALEGPTSVKAGVPILPRNVLKKPHLSEKAQSSNQINQYVFKVEASANKPLVRKEIEHRYNVKVKSVNIVRERPKLRYFRNRAGHHPGFKKAIITLKPGQKIEIT